MNTENTPFTSHRSSTKGRLMALMLVPHLLAPGLASAGPDMHAYSGSSCFLTEGSNKVLQEWRQRCLQRTNEPEECKLPFRFFGRYYNPSGVELEVACPIARDKWYTGKTTVSVRVYHPGPNFSPLTVRCTLHNWGGGGTYERAKESGNTRGIYDLNWDFTRDYNGYYSLTCTIPPEGAGLYFYRYGES